MSRFTYTIVNNVITAVTTGSSGSTIATIPDSVTSIANSVFSNNNVITGLICNSGSLLNRFGTSTFNACANLTNVSLNSTSLKSLGDSCFASSGLTSITIPNSVTTINQGCFENCYRLHTVEISPNSVKSIGFYTFSACTSLSSIIIPDSVTSILDGCFYDCTSLSSITLSNSLTSISDGCFENCTSLLSVIIPSAVTLITSNAFATCTGLTSVTLNCVGTTTVLGSNSFIGTTTSINKTTMVNLLAKGYTPTQLTSARFVPSIISRFSYTISSNIITGVTDSGTGTTYAVIPDSVTSIADSVFANISVKDVITELICTSGSLLNRFGTSTFSGCTNLTTVSLNSTSLKTFGDACFTSSGLISITIPNSVTSINDGCFQNCSSLLGIEIPNSVKSIGSNAFNNCSKLADVIIPNSVTSINTGCFQNCYLLTRLIFSNSLTSIPVSCCQACRSLPNITIPSSVTFINSSAFRNCVKLTSVTLQATSSSTTGLDTNTFFNTPLINKSTMMNLLAKGYTPSQLTTAGFAPSIISRFSYTISSNIITGVTDSGTGTTYAVIPDSVTSIADSVFANISVRDVITELICTSESFLNRFGSTVFQNCTNLSTVTLVSTYLTLIGNGCFSNCTSIQSITIPSAVTLIDTNAFQNCTGLTSVILKCVGTSTNLGTNSFLNTPLINDSTVRDLFAKGYTQPVLTNAGFPSISRFTYDISNNIITQVIDNVYGNTIATIPNSVTSTANGIFSNVNTLITDLICPIDSSLNTFGNNAFQDCTNLTSVTLNSTLKSVSESCFSGCSGLKSVTIPSAVTSINTNAFQNCTGLTSVTVEGTSSTTALNTNSFLNTPSINYSTVRNLLVKGYTQQVLTNAGFSIISRFTYDISNNIITQVNDNEYGTTIATIPNSVTSTINSLFINNTVVTELICPIDSSLNTFGNNAFQGCTNLTNITLNSTSLKSVSESCFSGCSGLKSITIPSAVTSINTNAFQNCTGLTSVTVEGTSSTTSLSANSFLNTPSINYSTVRNLLVKGYTQPVLTNAGFPLISRFTYDISNNIITQVIDNVYGNTIATIPNSVTSTLDGIFTNVNTLITDLICPIDSSLNTFGNNAFQDCTNLTSVTLNSTSLKSVSESCFSGCSGLKSVTIPSAVTSINTNAFQNCTGLTSVTLEGSSSTTVLSTNSFLNTPSINQLTITNLLIKGYTPLELNTAGFASRFRYTISNNIITAVTDGVGTTVATIPNSVTSTLDGIFSINTLITDLICTIDSSLNTFGNNAFQGCTNLTNITLNSTSLKSVSESCFSGCSGLKSVTIPSAVTSINTNAFQNCTGLTSVTLEGTSSTIVLNTNSFLNTPSINQLTITNLLIKGYTPLELNTAGFASRFRYTISNNVITAVTDGAGTSVATIPNSVTSTANGIFSNINLNTLITDLICPIDISLNTFGNNAFQGCTNLTNVTLNSSLKSVSESCFSGCSGLKSVTIPITVTSINTNAFQNCTGLTSVTLEGTLSTTALNTNSFIGTTNSINKSTITNLLAKGYTPTQLTSAGFTPSIISRFSYTISSNVITAVTDSGTGSTYTVIPDSVTSILNAIFLSNTLITEFICTNNSLLTTIPSTCFKGCTNLTSVTLETNYLTILNFQLFMNCTNLTNIKIPNSVKSIVDQCFELCSSLPGITIPNSVTSIGPYCFQNCSSLTSIIIPNSVMTIGNRCFHVCSSLSSIILSNSLTSIGTVCFAQCTSLVTITIPNSVTSIGTECFYNCSSLISITLSNSIKSIGTSFFYRCRLLTNVTIPDAVTLIDTNAFQDCTGLTSVTLEGTSSTTTLNTNSFLNTPSINYSTVRDLLAKGYTLPVLINAGFSTISRFTYVISNNIITQVNDNGYGTTIATIPNSVTGTDDSVFANTVITDLICPIDLSLNTFGNNTFKGCTDLTSVTLNSSLKSVSESCFSGCIGLKSVTIPITVTVINTNAFQNCTGLTSVTVEGTSSTTALNTNSFLNTPSINQLTITNLLIKGYTPLELNTAGFASRFRYTITNNVITAVTYGAGTSVATIPNSVTSTANSLFIDNTLITDLICPIDISLNTFGNNAFQGCTNLTNITFNSTSLKSVSESCFSGCFGLKSVTIPSAVTSIDTNAFQNCTGLTSVTLNSSLKSVSESCFSGCFGLKSVTIPSAVTLIDTNAFQNCSGLTSVTLEGSSSTTGLGTNSFLNTPSINQLTITNLSVKGYTQLQLNTAGFASRFRYTISNNVITQVNDNGVGTTVATIPNSVTSTINSLFIDNTVITDLICLVDSSLNTFGDNAFQGCTNLTNITLNSTSLKSVSESCFSGCTGLINITIPSAVTLIDTNAFQNCTGLTSVTLQGTSSTTGLGTNSFLNTPSINQLTITNLSAKGYTQLQLNTAGFKSRFSFITITILQIITFVIVSDTGTTVATIPNSVISTLDDIFLDNTLITDLICETGSSLNTFGNNAFKGCTNLTNVTLNSTSLKSVSEACFSGCTGLKSVTIPSAVTVINTNAFQNCTGLTSLTLERTLSTALNTNSFLNTSSVNSTSITNLFVKGYTQEYLTNAGFRFRFTYDISNNVITRVNYSDVGSAVATIPNSVTSIADGAFANTLVTDFICTGASLLNTLGKNAFQRCANLNNVMLNSPYLLSIPTYCFDGCSSLSNITIPNSIELINYKCFSDCSSLTNITIPMSVTLIESYAFKNCFRLSSVTLNCIGRSTFLKTNSFLGTNSITVATVLKLLAKGYNTAKITNAGFIAPPLPANVSSFSYTYK